TVLRGSVQRDARNIARLTDLSRARPATALAWAASSKAVPWARYRGPWSSSGLRGPAPRRRELHVSVAVAPGLGELQLEQHVTVDRLVPSGVGDRRPRLRALHVEAAARDDEFPASPVHVGHGVVH